jgi:integrase/recombinase XerC
MNESKTIPIYHPRCKKSGRPYSDKEMELAWALLDERGNTRVRFAIAITQEAGVRLGEICRLRIQDIDLTAQSYSVRLPSTTKYERRAFFGKKTMQCFEAWMNERDPGCGHDALLYNTLKKPYRPPALIAEINRTLCKTHRGRLVNETGLTSGTCTGSGTRVLATLSQEVRT